jgi:poly-gamma-glutamate capsule biosynthesis protein CapA/YwtB (metallophosphatase superfamily)
MLLQRIKLSRIRMYNQFKFSIRTVVCFSCFLSVICVSAVNAQDTTRISLLFVGDIMQHDSNIEAAFNPVTKKYDYSSCFEYVAPILRSADLTIGNLELTLAGSPYKGYPQFSAPDALAIELKRSGFDVLVTANNHSLDRRRKGLERTIDVLDSLQIQHTGTFKDSTHRANTFPLLLEKNGFRFLLLNYTYGTNGIPVTKPNIVNLIDTVTIKADLAKARAQQSDAIIVFMHWGLEYQSLPAKDQKTIAALCLREGAKLVIGSHPHVLQPMIWNKQDDNFIAYSLGNFVSGQRPRYRDGGAMLWIELQKIRNDSVSTTSISNTNYELEWIQKTSSAKPEFTSFPFRYFEKDTILIKSKTSQEALTLFANDSRKLYNIHNVNVPEKMSPRHDTLVYSIRLSNTEGLDSLTINNPIVDFYGIEKIEVENDTFMMVGKFYEHALAKQALLDIQSKTKLSQLRIVRRVDLEEKILSPRKDNPD